MPLNSIPPTTTVENLNVKRDEAKNVGINCDVGFWGGVIPGNEKDLGALLDQGVKGFKCFLIESGVDVSRLYRAGRCCYEWLLLMTTRSSHVSKKRTW